VLKLIEWLGVTEVGIKVFEDIDWNGQRAAATGQGTVRMVAGCEALKEKERALSDIVLDFFNSSSGTCASPLLLLGIGGDDPDDPPSCQEDARHHCPCVIDFAKCSYL
jgi:hypothetical protein